MHFMLWHHITLFDTEQSINFKNNCHIFCSTYQDNNCLSGFASEEDITTKARMITTVDGSYLSSSEPDRLYKDIHFTCDGNITQLVIGAKNNIGKSSNPPEVRFWRNSGGIYTQSESVIKLYYENATEVLSNEFSRWYNLSVPVSVEKGDILGIYQYLPTSEANSVIYYQEYSGPRSYKTNSELTGYNEYPLVSVIFGE